MFLSLTVASSHPAIVIGHSNEVIATGPSVRVDQELRHVQISEREKKPKCAHMHERDAFWFLDRSNYNTQTLALFNFSNNENTKYDQQK